MKKATLTIELNGKVFTTQIYSYRKVESVKQRLESVISHLRNSIPHYSSANFIVTL